MKKGEKRIILLVEDDTLIAEDEAATLEGFGYEVVIARDGETAVRMATGGEPVDLILMDIDLGRGMDGTEAAGMILKERDVPVVFLSSHTEPSVVEKTEKITSYGYVVKNSGETVLDASIKMAFKLFDTKQEEKKKEEALRESENRLRLITDNMVDCVALVDMRGVYQYVSPSYGLTLGYSPKDMVGRTGFDITHPDDIERVFLIYLDGIERGLDEHKYETRLRHRDGHYIPMEIRARPVKGPQGEMFGGVIVARDISERRGLECERLRAEAEKEKALEALKESEAKYRQLFHNAPAGIYEVDFISRRLTKVNAVICEYSGYTEEELLAMSPLDILTEESRAHFLQRLEKIFAGESVPINPEFQMINKDGSTRWVMLNVRFLKSEGRVTGAAVVAHDITERRNLEKKLRETEERYRALYGSNINLVYVFDLEGRFMDANDRALGLLGYGRDEIGNVNFASLIDGAQLEKAAISLESVIATGEQSAPIEYHLTGKHGAELFVETSGSLLYRDGVPHAVIAMARDITERKRAEEDIKALLAEKELLIQEVHHRIKNNMNTVRSLLSLHSKTVKSTEASAALSDAAGRIRSMTVLYDKLYRVADIREMPVREYLSPLVDEIVALFPGSAGVRTVKNMGDFNLGVRTLIPLGIIVNELVTNAMKYAFSGREGGIITVSALMDNGRVLVRVADNGVGMPPDVTIGASAGFGLGLVDTLARQLRGEVSIDRAEGTMVEITFCA